MRTFTRRRTSAVTAAGALALTLAACGGGQGQRQGQGQDGSENIVVGTTDTVQTLDPAKCYSYYCSNVFQNAGNTLITYQPGSTEISPQLATKMPEISDRGRTYTFTLRQGVTFHDGSRMTAEDVKFSLNRARWINHPEGAGFLLSGIESIETPNPSTVVIHLEEPDITFSSKLAYTVATILPSNAYPSPGRKLPDNASPGTYERYIKEKFIGTGPYKIAAFRENQSLELTSFDGFWGRQPKNDNVLVQFFAKSSQMQAALRSGNIDVAYRHLTPQQRQSLQGNQDTKVVEGAGASIRYLVFNPALKPFGNVEVRKAVAAAVDRKRIVDNVLAGAGTPLYSMIPPTFEANVPSFKKTYQGKKPSDFVNGKVQIELWYSRGHYGDTEPALAQTIARTLEETGSFEVTLKSSEWAQFTANAYPGESGQYPVFLLGWYPDYLDPDDYVGPFWHSERSFLQMYANPRMDKLIQREQTAGSVDSRQRMRTFAEIQRLGAEDVPTLPLYVVTPYAYAQKGVEGVQDTMGPSQIFRYYLLSETGG